MIVEAHAISLLEHIYAKSIENNNKQHNQVWQKHQMPQRLELEVNQIDGIDKIWKGANYQWKHLPTISSQMLDIDDDDEQEEE